jgi:hypothetical protein
MIELYLLEQSLKMERALLDERHARRVGWLDRLSISKVAKPPGFRRWLARALLVLADRLDPRPAISAVHTPRCPTLNGRLHHA